MCLFGWSATSLLSSFTCCYVDYTMSVASREVTWTSLWGAGHIRIGIYLVLENLPALKYSCPLPVSKEGGRNIWKQEYYLRMRIVGKVMY